MHNNYVVHLDLKVIGVKAFQLFVSELPMNAKAFAANP